MQRLLQAAAVGFAVVVAISGEARASDTALPVPSVTIMQGDVLSEELITEERFVANPRQLQNFHTVREAVVGKVARRVLPAGHAIPINALRDPWVFKEGERVSLVFSTGGLSIEATGIALEPGIIGKFINARNSDTGIVVRGMVQPSGRIHIGGE